MLLDSFFTCAGAVTAAELKLKARSLTAIHAEAPQTKPVIPGMTP